ncbi:hypothetical protein DY218_01355 [Streptomyces triticagri]|uniref:Gram-positive cocci surface proteins LPxTG domain-containing protein n=1 Tax=Streptomyces triticagri TaxID=2293568 RepID=A0A372MC17_9ACTN|nr:hypothetical protein [Streptomyces triticagri]RFU88494.1 hypothetical protein DY218_01355 [Streptomyces triticagri]
MRKALTVSAIAVATSMALAVPATAFAADATPSPGATAPASDKARADVSITSSSKDETGYKAGEKVTFQVTTEGAAEVSAVSDALTGISVTSQDTTTYTGTGTVKDDYGTGTAELTVTVDYPDTGARTTATFPVNTGESPKPTPDPAEPSLSLSTDGGKAGDKVAVTVRDAGSDSVATVRSDAFGGTVKLERDPQHEGTWHGTATVADTAESGSYRVDALLDGKVVDSAKFGVQGSDKPAPQPTPGKSTLAVNPGGGRTGDRIAVTVDAPSINPSSKISADSRAFGGKVALSPGKDGKWHGTATVAKVKNGDYKVTTGTGADPVTFTVTSKSHVKPLDPSDHKTPKGSVNTGMAPASHDQQGLNAAAVVGFVALGTGSLAGAGLLRGGRRHG